MSDLKSRTIIDSPLTDEEREFVHWYFRELRRLRDDYYENQKERQKEYLKIVEMRDSGMMWKDIVAQAHYCESTVQRWYKLGKELMRNDT